jgi:putative ABC transport system permease protein
MAETAVVAVVAAVAAAVPAILAGRLVIGLVRDAGMVADSVSPSPGVVAVAVTGAVLAGVAVGAAAMAAYRGTRIAAAMALRESAIGPARMSRWRQVLGWFCVLCGVDLAVITVAVMADVDDPFAAMSTAGQASVWTSIGFAVFAPVLLRWATALGGGVLRRFGPAGRLAAYDTGRRSQLLAGVLMPVVVFVGISTGTTYLMAIENLVAAQRVQTVDDQAVETLNAIVVAMIAVFAAIMVVNTVAAVVAGRRREFARQRLVGATPNQVRTMMLLETGLVAVTGILLGGLAALTTVLPYSQVKLDRLLPDIGLAYFALISLAALVITLGSTYLATRRALAPPAVEAAALAA